jgi:hypothetical protein
LVAFGGALLLSLAAAGPLAAAQKPARGVQPTLGWLPGEPGASAIASDPRCAAPSLKSGPFAKLDRGLVALFCNPAERRSSEVALLSPSPRGMQVVVDATAVDSPKRLARDLQRLGGRGISTYGAVVSARVPIDRLDALAALPTLRFARPFAARINAGTVTGQHLQALDVADLQASGFDGTGVEIGVLSDSFDCLGGAATDIANGDLPAGATALVDEVGCGSGTDEGRAMMQLVHDLVPGATQTFHTAFGGAAAFANGIQALAAAGATVIVDDVTYFAEPMVQDGVIAQSVDDVATNDGVAYFSSAGNNGNESYTSTFRNGLFLGPGSGPLNDFDPGVLGTDTRQLITIPSGTTVLVLNWDQPYFSASGLGGSTTDLDFHVYDSGGDLITSSINDNIGGDPVEILSIDNTGAPTTVELEIEYFDGPNGPLFPIATLVKYVAFSDITMNQFPTTAGTAYGHANAEGAITIGAANYFQTPPFGVDPAVAASYSSEGGVPIYFDLTDTPIGPVTRGKPEVVGPDGANTTFFGSDLAHGHSYPGPQHPQRLVKAQPHDGAHRGVERQIHHVG